MRLFNTVLFTLFTLFPVYPQSFDAEIVKKNTKVTVETDRIVTEETFRIKINKRTNESRFSDVEIFYQGSEKVSSIRGWIEDSKGNVVRELQKKDISESHALTGISFYDDSYIIRFSLRHNNYPYYICYSYKKTTPDYLVITSWSPAFSYDVPTREASLEMIVPEGFKFNYEASGISDPTVVMLKNATSYLWEAKYEKMILPEVWSPPVIFFLPKVRITPDRFNYDSPGSFESWGSYGKWCSLLLEGINTLPAEELLSITERTKNTASDREKVKILYHYLQDNTRYINVATDFGGYKPMSAQYVTDNKYGDCKALVNYTKTLLENVGIKSYYTLVYAGDEPIESEKGIPFPNFNHVILMVPVDKDTIWLECTNKTLPFDYLGTFTANRKALVIDGDNSRFVSTQSLSKNQTETIRHYDFKVSGVGYITFNGEYLLRGVDFEAFLNISNDLDHRQQKALLDKYLAYSGLEVTSYKISRSCRDDKEMLFTLEGNANRFLRKIEDEMIISPMSFDLPEFEVPVKRTLPLNLTIPVAKKDTVNILLDPGLYINHVPGDVTIENEFGSYKIKATVAGNKAQLIKELYIAPGHYEQEKYPAFYSFIMSVRKAEKECLFLISNSPKR